jgi:hypothetical protein
MPDITMCSGQGCPLRGTCYRYTAKPTPHWQSYFQYPPYRLQDNGQVECDSYWRNSKAATTT